MTNYKACGIQQAYIAAATVSRSHISRLAAIQWRHAHNYSVAQ
jgi:hypothetical protein